jgi:N-methylhydantoinase A
VGEGARRAGGVSTLFHWEKVDAEGIREGSEPKKANTRYIMKTYIGIDTGGTFTDFVALYEDGSRQSLKLLSTPDDPSRAVLAGIAILSKGPLDVTYGSTVATNALLERRGARTAFITNKNFEDLLLLARQNRPHLYQLRVEPLIPLVPRELTFGLSGRLEPNGQIHEPLREEEFDLLCRSINQKKIESIAVCFLHSYANPAHEKAVAKALAHLQIPVSLSCEIIPEYREYERASTTVVNAYVAPKMREHLERLSEGLRSSSSVLRVMQSNGGAIRAELAAQEPVRTVLSGPAGGVVGAFLSAQRAGFNHVITFDMGGTSTDVSLCDGQIRSTSKGRIAGLPVRVPLVDVHTVGAGGGSIARIDPGGALKVGPESASAVPGPACYAKGGPVTVTDANVILGRVDPSSPLGGTLSIDAHASFVAMEALALQMKKTAYQAAEGIIRVANASMEKALRVVSIERGFDPRSFALLSFGGAGGLHACALAEALQIPTVIVPPYAGVLSALGMLEAEVIRDASKTLLASINIKQDTLQNHFAPLQQQATQELLQEGFTQEALQVKNSLDIRYQGQSFEVSIPYSSQALRALFEEEYQRRYGYTLPDKPVEIVTLRVRVIGKHLRPESRLTVSGTSEPVPVRELTIYEDGEAKVVPVYTREALGLGCVLWGPALICESIATSWVPSGWKISVHASGALLLHKQK